MLISTRSPPGCFGSISKSSAPPFCWLYQYGMHHLGGVTAMVCSPEIFEPVTLFWRPEGGTPSKNFAPRNILGLPNPHRGRRRGGSTFPGAGAGRGSSRAAAGRAAGAGPVQAVPRAGRGPQQAAGVEKKGGRGIDKASSSLAYGYTAKSICRSGKESDPSGSGPRWAGFGPFGGRGWC